MSSQKGTSSVSCPQRRRGVSSARIAQALPTSGKKARFTAKVEPFPEPESLINNSPSPAFDSLKMTSSISGKSSITRDTARIQEFMRSLRRRQSWEANVV
ncbi:hypothetical protein CEB3_c08910 [Peptococcaceae bacterium CEB3]|nr:hypothetical protein CEB3_c08910 [Peptococcaceae bacterium CEB3]